MAYIAHHERDGMGEAGWPGGFQAARGAVGVLRGPSSPIRPIWALDLQ